MSLTTTSLTHPTMIAKIRKGLYYAHKAQGHLMNGHGNRVYIQNAKGRNIMRLNWVGGRQGYIVYGSESRDITNTVKAALQRSLNTFDERPTLQEIKRLDVGSPRWSNIPRVVGLAMLGASLTACQSPGAVTVIAAFFKGLFS